jgi:hypothetical protein
MMYLFSEENTFFDVPVREHSDEDIRTLAARRTREHSEGGRERLSRAMWEPCKALPYSEREASCFAVCDPPSPPARRSPARSPGR